MGEPRMKARQLLHAGALAVAAGLPLLFLAMTAGIVLLAMGNVLLFGAMVRAVPRCMACGLNARVSALFCAACGGDLQRE
jgi:uncharacterized membrane protein YccC